MRASLWIVVYLFIVALLTIIEVIHYNTLRPSSSLIKRNTDWNIILTLILAIGMGIFIGVRPESIEFVDMMTYVDHFETSIDLNLDLTWETNNLIFDNAIIWFATHDYTTTQFFLTVALIYFVAMGWAMARIFGRNSLYAFIIYLGAFSTFSYATNGIRAGLAASLFLVALSYYRKNYWWMFFWMIVSYGVHHSMQLPIAALLISLLVTRKNLYFIFWLMCLIISALQITYFQTLFGYLTDSQGQTYLLNDAEGIMEKSGFRLDFVLYTAIPIGIYWIVSRKGNIVSETYDFYMRYYLLVSGIWMLCIYAPFTNRIAYLAWQILPLVSTYPYLNINLKDVTQYRELNLIALTYLSFTIGYIMFLS